MAAVEFLPEGNDDALGAPAGRPVRGRPPRPVLVVVAAVVVLVAAAVVVGRNSGRPPARAAAPSAPVRSPAASAPSTLSVPASAAFGPEVVDVLAVGDRVYTLTPTLIGLAHRDGGALTVRPAPLGLSNQAGYGRLLPDLAHHVLWAVAIGGTAIGGYDSDTLDSVSDAVAPYPISGAAALDGRLYLAGAGGLYRTTPGHPVPVRVPGPRVALGPLAADATAHQLLAASAGPDPRLFGWTAAGQVRTASLPSGRIDSLAVSAGRIWVSGRAAGHAWLIALDRATWRAVAPAWAGPSLGSRADIVAGYGAVLLIRSDAAPNLVCADAATGTVKQVWTAPSGASTLNERGLLIATRQGLVALNARDCLAGS